MGEEGADAMTGPTSGAPITTAEMVEMFGEMMPIQAATLLHEFDGSRTIGELRAELRRIAEGWRKADLIDRVARRLWENIPCDSGVDPPDLELLRPAVVAMLRDLREPTQAMLDAGSQARALSVYSIWRVMLAKAIES